MLDTTTWLQWAQYYASLGYAVLPLAGKVPVTPHGVHDASRDPAQLTDWARRFPGANIGVAVPAGKAVIDVDPRNDGETTIDAYERQHGKLPYTSAPVQETGSGGWHLWLDLRSVDDALPGKLGPGVDVKQHGGYVVAAPSIHPDTGKPYKWHGDGLALPRRDVTPPWIQALARSRSESRATRDSSNDARLGNLRFGMDPDRAISTVPDEAIVAALRAVEPIYQPGQRHHVRVKMGALLNRLGWSRESIERFGFGLHAAFGGDDANKIARETIMGMSYPSGYYDLIAMAPSGYRDAIAKSLDAIHNPFGAELRATNARARAEIEAAFGALQPRSTPTTHEPAFGHPVTGVVGPVQSPPAAVPIAAALAQQVNALTALGKPHDVHTPAPPISYCVEGLPWHFDAVNAIVGFASSGKSPFAASLIVALNSGNPWQGRATKKGRVLVLAFEGARSLLRHIQRHARATCQTISEIDFVECDAGALVDDPTYVLNLRRIAASYQYVFVDTYNGAAASAEIRDTKFALAAKQLEIENVATFVVLHTTKDEDAAPTLRSIAGTGALAGAIKAAVGLWRPPGHDGYTFECVCVRTPDKPFDPFRYRLKDSGDGWVYETVAIVKPEDAGESGETQRATIARYVNLIPSLFEGKPTNYRMRYGELKAELKAENGDLVKHATRELESLSVLIRDQKRGADLGWLCRGAAPRDHHGHGAPMPTTLIVAPGAQLGPPTAGVPILPRGPGFDPAWSEPPTPEQKNE